MMEGMIMGWSRTLPAGAILVLLSSLATAKADPMAYMGTDTGEFGTIDLTTGVFSLLGNSGQTLAGMAVDGGKLFASAYHTASGTLFNINPANGMLTTVGSSGVDIDDFGSTTSGLFGVGVNGNLYSFNASNGAATLIGPTGIGFGSWRGLSTNSSNLYFADGIALYTLNTSTGAATLIGDMGGGVEIGALLEEGGVLYGGEEEPSLQIDTLDPVTGLATSGPPLTGATGHFYALAPSPIPTPPPPVPEPATFGLLGVGIGGLAILRRGKRRSPT
jgi:PEP-CTERM motif